MVPASTDIKFFRAKAQTELPEAERAVHQSKEHLEHLEARLAEGKAGPNTRQLVKTLRQTYELQLRHVETLKREITEGI